MLSGLDRMLGSAFGALRGLLVVALFVLVGDVTGFDSDNWGRKSRLLPYIEVVADWITVMAPKGYDLIIPDEVADELPLDLPVKL